MRIASTLPISVVMTVLNDALFVRHTLRSLKSQTRRPYELVVVDRGSVDGAADLARGFGARVIRCDGAGIAEALNVAVAATTQPWIAPLIPGAIWEPRKLDREWDAVLSAPHVDLAITDILRLTEPGPPRFAESAAYHALDLHRSGPGIGICEGTGTTRFFVERQNGAHPTMLVRRSTFDRAGGYDTGLVAGEDFELMLRLLNSARVAVVAEPLTHVMSPLGPTEYRCALAHAMIATHERVAKDPSRYPADAETLCRGARKRTVDDAVGAFVRNSEFTRASALIALDGASSRPAMRMALTAASALARVSAVRRAHDQLLRTNRGARAIARRAAHALRGLRQRADHPIIIGHTQAPRIGLPDAVRLAALTFDDGPDAETTPLLLQALQRAGVRATFFVIGAEAQAYPGLCRDIVAAGMELGNHSMTHSRLTTLDSDAQAREIEDGGRAIETASGVPVRLFRPPYGALDARTASAAKAAGQTIVLWNVDSEDWSSADEDDALRAVTEQAQSPAIILLHNGQLSTAALVPRIVELYRSAGFAFVTVSEMLERLEAAQINAPRRAILRPATNGRHLHLVRAKAG